MKKSTAASQGAGLIANLINQMVEEQQATGLPEEALHFLSTPRGRPYVRGLMKELVAGEFTTTPTHFHRLSPPEGLVLAPTKPKAFSTMGKTFNGFVDPDFTNWNADDPGVATDEATVAVDELIEDKTFEGIFVSKENFDHIALTPAQIEQFILSHRDWLRTDGWATFFPFKSYGERFIASVCVASVGSLEVSVVCFDYPRDWDADDRLRVVSLQLAET